MGSLEFFRVESLASGAFAFLMEHNQVGQHHRGGSNSPAQRIGGGHQYDCTPSIVLLAGYPGQPLQAGRGLARIVHEVCHPKGFHQQLLSTLGLAMAPPANS
jgi:hypothetical protein